jgi:DNA mismatch repair protein MutS
MSRRPAFASLKIKHNNVLGYFIEVTTTHEDRMRAMPELFIHRQTTAGQVRFTTLALNELETRILNAGNHALEIEKRHYSWPESPVLDLSAPIALAARALAEIDWPPALPTLPPPKTGVSHRSTTAAPSRSRAGGIRWWNAPCAAGRQPFVANDCALTTGNAGNLAADRAEHGG